MIPGDIDELLLFGIRLIVYPSIAAGIMAGSLELITRFFPGMV